MQIEIKPKGNFRHGNNCNWSHQFLKPLYQTKITKTTTVSPVKSRK